MSGTVAFVIVMTLSFIYRYFTKEKLTSFLGVVFGLGFLGFSGGLLAILEQPNIGGAIMIIVVVIFSVWGVNIGDKIAEKAPKTQINFVRRKSDYVKVKLPSANLIVDISAKKRVPDSLKAELSDREFILPADLPIEELIQRVKRRLITDWGIGDAEMEIDHDGKVTHLAVSANEKGLSTTLTKGEVALPLEANIMPSCLIAGDIVRVFLDNGEIIESTEVLGVDNQQKTLTIARPEEWIDKLHNVKAKLVVGLPQDIERQNLIYVKRMSGAIEEFNVEKIGFFLEKIGVDATIAKDAFSQIKKHFLKIEGPVSPQFIKLVIFQELEKINPEEAKKLKTRKLGRLML
jgi:hypothetical protein